MARPNRSTLPSYLDPKNRHGNRTDQQNVQAATGGDIRRFKLNHAMTAYETIRQIDDCLRLRRHGTEYVKMLSSVYPRRKEEVPDFVAVCRKNDVIPYIGGGATETAIKKDELLSFTKELQRFGIDAIEISNSDGDLPASETAQMIAGLRKDFKHVLVEIGTKTNHCYHAESDWQRDLDAALEADADRIILEGTGGGRSGIYNHNAEGNSLLVTGLAKRAGTYQDRFIVEAPYEQQRSYWMGEVFDWDIRLGNIPLNNDELANTEAMRVQALQSGIHKQIAERRQAHRDFYDELLIACGEQGLETDEAIFYEGLQGISGKDLTNFPHWKDELRTYIARIRQPRYGRIMVIDPRMLGFFGNWLE